MTAEDYMRQAHMTAHEYMMHGKRDIDEMFGDGFAKKHPELLGAYMQTAARDYDTSIRLAGKADLVPGIG
jgi:hypothetical protein